MYLRAYYNFVYHVLDSHTKREPRIHNITFILQAPKSQEESGNAVYLGERIVEILLQIWCSETNLAYDKIYLSHKITVYGVTFEQLSEFPINNNRII